jgi:hypothetical protein
MAAIQNFSIDQGTTTPIIFTIKQLTFNTLPWDAITNPYIPVDLTNATIQTMWRKDIDDYSPVFTATNISPDVHFVITNATGGVFQLNLLPADTTGIIFTGDSIDLVYDIEITDITGAITRALEGTITIVREVTR